MPYLIDGHNVIAALPDINLEDDNDEAQLIIKLRSWLSQARKSAVVIFDGGIPGGPSTSLSSNNIKVIFAARHYTIADAIINERVKALPDPGNWTVVSSDREVLDRAEMAGARTMTSQTFADYLQQQLITIKEKPEGLGAGELEQWLDVFTEAGENVTRAPEPRRPAPAQPASTPGQRSRTQRLQASKKPAPPAKQAESRGVRSIGEQIGYTGTQDVEPEPLPSRPSEKPMESTAEEIEAWLKIFPEPERSHIPAPNLPKRKKKKAVVARPVVRKSGDLSEGEVNAWLQVFGPEAENLEAKVPPTQLKPKTRTVSSTLAKHQENLTPLDQQHDDSSLSADDLEMWYRMFGRDEE